MEKFKFVSIVVFFVVLTYIMLTSFMPVISDLSEASATEVQATADNISNYVGAVESVQYMPLLLYFIPGVIGLVAIVWKLKYAKP